MTRFAAIGAVVASALALSVGVSLAATAGELDPSYDGDGKRVLPIRIDPGDVLAQSDGKVLVADSRSFRVARLSSDGALDNSFGGDGVAAADFGADAWIDAAALQPDGKIVVAGHNKELQVAIARFTTSGSLDVTFAPGGPDGDGMKVFTEAYNGPANVGGVVVQPDGRIVIAGGTGAGITAMRLGPTGAHDGTQYEYARAEFTNSEVVNAATLAADGSVLVTGHSQTGQSTDLDAMVVRFKEDGRLDKSLGSKGFVTLGPDGRDDSATAVFEQPDGKIVLAGNSGSAEQRATVTRLNADGTPDDGFGEGGYAAPDFEGQDVIAGAALQPDGKFLVGATLDPELKFAVGRLDAAGKLDPSFGSGGKTTIAFDDIALASAAGMQPDGKFVIAGITAVENQTSVRTAVARVLEDQPPATGGQGPDLAPGDPPALRRCGGKQATIVGSAGRDSLRGTKRADVIVALGGNDRIRGLGGNDVVCGGRGRDVLAGGAGRDRLAGGPQRDTCIGGAARDRASACEIRRSL